MLLVILGWVAWIFGSRKDSVLSVPRLGILAAVLTLTLGGLLGVLLGVMIATGNDILPGDTYASHPATMVIGFLVPSAWPWRNGLRPRADGREGDRGQGGFRWAPFLGGIFVTAGLLADSPPLISVSLPFEIIGVGIFVKRLRPGLSRVDARGPGRTSWRHRPSCGWS